ncbi:hypothetical protein TNCV_2517201 [Trichonephila clavipes]|nr:hypothetical protein TNCV_2517201 [Trichonephila clavipes]
MSFRRQYEQLSQFERWRIISMMETGWSARTPLTDQSSRRLLHRKKCTRKVNSFIGRDPGKGNTSLEVPVSSRTIRRRLAEGHL